MFFLSLYSINSRLLSRKKNNRLKSPMFIAAGASGGQVLLPHVSGLGIAVRQGRCATRPWPVSHYTETGLGR